MSCAPMPARGAAASRVCEAALGPAYAWVHARAYGSVHGQPYAPEHAQAYATRHEPVYGSVHETAPQDAAAPAADARRYDPAQASAHSRAIAADA